MRCSRCKHDQVGDKVVEGDADLGVAMRHTGSCRQTESPMIDLESAQSACLLHDVH